MSKRNSDLAILAAGVGLWYVGAKTFSDYHGSVQAGTVESFQHEHATAIGSVATLAGLGLVVYGVYRMDPTWGKGVGAVLAGLVAYNAYKHSQGEPLISLSPFKHHTFPA